MTHKTLFAISILCLTLLAGCPTPESPGTQDVVLSTDATLSALSLEGVDISPAFSADVTEYTASVGYTVTSVTVAAAASNALATVSGTGSVSLSVGSNPLNVVVTAENGDTKTYAITVTRVAAEADATLSALSLGGVPFTPTFAPGIAAYTAAVANGTTSVTVSATPAGALATVTGTGTVSLSIGSNPLSIVVTAQNGDTKTYAITVTRGSVVIIAN